MRVDYCRYFVIVLIRIMVSDAAADDAGVSSSSSLPLCCKSYYLLLLRSHESKTKTRVGLAPQKCERGCVAVRKHDLQAKLRDGGLLGL